MLLRLALGKQRTAMVDLRFGPEGNGTGMDGSVGWGDLICHSR